jgi:hypothetical protein
MLFQPFPVKKFSSGYFYYLGPDSGPNADPYPIYPLFHTGNEYFLLSEAYFHCDIVLIFVVLCCRAQGGVFRNDAASVMSSEIDTTSFFDTEDNESMASSR